MSIHANLAALHVGAVQTRGADALSSQAWTTGFYKARVAEPLQLRVPSSDGTRTALAGDAQADLINHGGPEKAVCVYAAEHYPFWRETLNVAEFNFGAFGENFTIEGLTEAQVCIGDIFCIGEGEEAARVQISQPRQPCWKLARRWQIKDLALQVQNTGKTGWYLRVLREGRVAPNAQLRLIERPHPQWTLERANQIMHHTKDDLDAAAQLAACPSLSSSWKKTLQKRVAGQQTDAAARLEGR